MFVFRPQQTLTHAQSCGSTGSRGPHHNVSRQAAKNQRRTQPKPRRPQAQQRRRQLIRDLVAAGHQPRLTSGDSVGSREPRGSVLCTDSFLESSHEGTHSSRGKGSARARLCARLLQRSCSQLEAALEQRHGEMWPKHVLEGDFQAMEAMRRICESFCLRPELERQVLKTTADRAHAVLKRQAEAQICDRQDATECKVSGSDKVVCSADADSEGDTTLQRQVSAWGSEAPSSAPDDSSDAGTLDGASSDATSADECFTIDESVEKEIYKEDPMDLGLAGGFSGGSSSECESGGLPPWKVTWRSRVLRVLGLQRVWPRQSVCATKGAASLQQQESDSMEESESAVLMQEPVPSSTMPRKSDAKTETRSYVDETEGEDEEEERALSSKLVAAVRNAELHAACAREKVLRSSNDTPSTTAPPSLSCATSTASSCGGSSVRFSRNSEVSFFSTQQEAAAEPEPNLQYVRPVETKVFDGPSGHKAKRTPSAEKKTSPCEDTDEDDRSTEDDDEDWEDRCDDIAELMSQERCGMLWSQSW